MKKIVRGEDVGRRNNGSGMENIKVRTIETKKIKGKSSRM